MNFFLHLDPRRSQNNQLWRSRHQSTSSLFTPQPGAAVIQHIYFINPQTGVQTPQLLGLPEPTAAGTQKLECGRWVEINII